MATLDERGQGIPNDGDKRGGRKGYQYDVIEKRFHGDRRGKYGYINNCTI